MTELNGDINAGFIWLMIAGEIMIFVIAVGLSKLWPHLFKDTNISSRE